MSNGGTPKWKDYERDSWKKKGVKNTALTFYDFFSQHQKEFFFPPLYPDGTFKYH